MTGDHEVKTDRSAWQKKEVKHVYLMTGVEVNGSVSGRCGWRKGGSYNR